MSFYPDKCEVLRVTNKRKHIIHPQCNRVLKTVNKTKYLGVIIQSKLNWKAHINNITKKANNVRAFLQKNLANCPVTSKNKPIRLMCAPSKNMHPVPGTHPHTKELTTQLEMVQTRAARCVTADYHRRHSVTYHAS